MHETGAGLPVRGRAAVKWKDARGPHSGRSFRHWAGYLMRRPCLPPAARVAASCRAWRMQSGTPTPATPVGRGEQALGWQCGRRRRGRAQYACIELRNGPRPEVAVLPHGCGPGPQAVEAAQLGVHGRLLLGFGLPGLGLVLAAAHKGGEQHLPGRGAVRENGAGPDAAGGVGLLGFGVRAPKPSSGWPTSARW